MSDGDHITFFIAYRTGAWSRGCIDTYRRQFPHEHLLIVDNNDPDYVEGSLLAKEPNVTLIRGKGTRHGDGMNAALAWCREKGIPIMVHIEPDMLFLHRQWKIDLLAGVRDGYELVGTHKTEYGPVHPAASAWDTTVNWHSFGAGRKSWRERLSTDYRQLLRLKGQPGWLYRNWDTAQRNWFQAARRDRVLLLDENRIHGRELYHFWNGSRVNPGARYAEVIQRARRI
jgi:hypothetical protein